MAEPCCLKDKSHEEGSPFWETEALADEGLRTRTLFWSCSDTRSSGSCLLILHAILVTERGGKQTLRLSSAFHYLMANS